MLNKNSNVVGILKTLGPGILFAGAAIGGSHLIQSTRAGADYYFDLLWIVLLVNLIKYPFFEYGHRYFAATGNSLLEGYLKIGKSAVYTFTIVSIITGVVNYLALSVVTAGLLENMIGVEFDNTTLTLIVMYSSIILMLIGKYSLLDKTIKIVVILLSISTITAFILALFNAPQVTEFQRNDIWAPAGIAFLIALMGWMPAPVELSVWTSLWAIERQNETNHIPTMREVLIDFHIGYVGTAIMAVFFLGLGAFIMYGNNISFANKGEEFAYQLVSLYTQTLGNWSSFIIETAAFLTIFSSLATVIDGYPRSVASALCVLSEKFKNSKNPTLIVTLIMSLSATVILLLIPKTMKDMIDMATIISFLVAPLISFINYKAVTSKHFPENYKPKLWLKVLSFIGIFYLTLFSLIYLYYSFFK